MVTVDPDATAVTPNGTETDRPQRGRLLVFGVVAIALLMVSIDQTSVATALPSIQRDLDTSLAWSGWTITVYSLGQIIGMPVAGKLSDQFGRKAVFMVVVGVFLAVLCAVSLVCVWLVKETRDHDLTDVVVAPAVSD